MNGIDVGIVLCIVVSVIYSLFKGMTREIFSLISLFLGYFVANQYGNSISHFLLPFLPYASLAAYIGFFIVFIVVTILVSIVGRMIKKILHLSNALSFIDRALGGVIGLVKGVLIITVIMVMVSAIPVVKKRLLAHSEIAPYFLSSSTIFSEIPGISGDIRSNKLLHGLQNRLTDVVEKIGEFDLKKNIGRIGSSQLPDPDAHISDDARERLDVLIKKNTK